MQQILTAAQTTSSSWQLKDSTEYGIVIHNLPAAATWGIQINTPAGWVNCRDGSGDSSEHVLLRGLVGATYRLNVTAAGAVAYVMGRAGSKVSVA